MTTSTKAPRLKAPAGACDTHMHFYDSKYPLAPTAVVKPPEGATVETYRAVQKRLGLSRTVVVQPTAYGYDNRCTMESIAALGVANARGIAVVAADVSDAELKSLTEGGIRGLRLQMLPGGAIPWEAADAIVKHVQSAGWHIQLQMDGRQFPEREAQIMKWPGRIVIDHVGRFMGTPGTVNDAGFKCLLRMIDTGRVWVKLSAPYENATSGPPDFPDVSLLAKALVKHAPQRMLWASNWPHPGQKAPPDEADLLDLLLDWAPDEATRNRILAENAAEVYGF
jgi:D-galactarolactone isomerase